MGVPLVLAASKQPTLATVDRLAHEYSFKDELDGTWAVRPLELVQDRGQTILVLEDPGGELLGTPMEVGRFLRIAVGVAAALGKVHQHGLIHKDIKPANILVNGAAGEEIRLTGFGVATRLPRERQAPDPPEVVAGTLAYVAPEQTGANTPAEWPEEAVFEIVNQLGRGAGAITSDEERKQLAELKSRDLG
jgi:serine/threonine protein kinase